MSRLLGTVARLNFDGSFSLPGLSSLWFGGIERRCHCLGVIRDSYVIAAARQGSNEERCVEEEVVPSVVRD